MGDLVLATGLSYETVAGMTRVQFVATQKALKRKLEFEAMIGGLGMFGGTGKMMSQDVAADRGVATSALERKVAALKQATGRETFSLEEVF